MKIPPKKQELLDAVLMRDKERVRELLEEDRVDPNFPANARTTPLLEAVRHGDLSLVKMLVEAGADPRKSAYDGLCPEDLADELGFTKIWDYLDACFYEGVALAAVLRKAGSKKKIKKASSTGFNDWDDDDAIGSSYKEVRKAFLAYLDAREQKAAVGGFNHAATPASTAPKAKWQGPLPVFKAETLPEIFEPKKWVGKTSDMQLLWDEVPKSLKKKFNFAAALVTARQQTLQGQAPTKSVLKKNTPPPASPPTPPQA